MNEDIWQDQYFLIHMLNATMFHKIILIFKIQWKMIFEILLNFIKKKLLFHLNQHFLMK